MKQPLVASHYQQLLGLGNGWRVEEVEWDHGAREVRIRVEAKREALRCPECDAACPGYDRRERRWRHLDTMQYRTILIAEVPRVECAEHGRKQIRVPWVAAGSRFTALFEALVIPASAGLDFYGPGGVSPSVGDAFHLAALSLTAEIHSYKWEVIAAKAGFAGSAAAKVATAYGGLSAGLDAEQATQEFMNEDYIGAADNGTNAFLGALVIVNPELWPVALLYSAGNVTGLNESIITFHLEHPSIPLDSGIAISLSMGR